ALRPVARIGCQIGMNESGERLVELSQSNVVVATPVHDLAMSILTRRAAMTPFRPPGGFIRPALLLFPVEFIVGKRATDEREAFEPRLHPLALSFQPFRLASQRAKPFVDRPAQTLLLRLFFRKQLPHLGRHSD